jgi:hypothetical protein
MRKSFDGAGKGRPAMGDLHHVDIERHFRKNGDSL